MVFKDVWIFINQLLIQNYHRQAIQKRAIVIDFANVVFIIETVNLRLPASVL